PPLVGNTFTRASAPVSVLCARHTADVALDEPFPQASPTPGGELVSSWPPQWSHGEAEAPLQTLEPLPCRMRIVEGGLTCSTPQAKTSDSKLMVTHLREVLCNTTRCCRR